MPSEGQSKLFSQSHVCTHFPGMGLLHQRIRPSWWLPTDVAKALSIKTVAAQITKLELTILALLYLLDTGSRLVTNTEVTGSFSLSSTLITLSHHLHSFIYSVSQQHSWSRASHILVQDIKKQNKKTYRIVGEEEYKATPLLRKKNQKPEETEVLYLVGKV